MKANSVGLGVNITPRQINFRSENDVHAPQDGHDEFVRSKERPQKKKTAGYIVAALIALGAGALLAHQSGWFGKCKEKLGAAAKETIGIKEFKSIDEAKKYFEDLGIETEFRGVTDEHLPLLNRIQSDLSKIKEMGVKIDKPDSINISDWSNVSEYEELCRKRGVSIERKEGYFAFCSGADKNQSHIFINGSKPTTDVFRHEMGHANHHRGHDSFWEAKGVKGYDFANKQLELLGENIKVYDGGAVHNSPMFNVFKLAFNNASSRYVFPTAERETRYIYVKNMLEKMQKETNCYSPENLGEQVAYVFDGLIKGNKFSDEVMLYYDFAGGARIPNLKFGEKTYDEYIESLYNNKELIEKLRANVKISKI